jgi:hypothetical protein
MKKEIMLLAFLAALVLSCKEPQKECIPADLKFNLPGEWNAAMASTPEQVHKVKFNGDGTYTEEGDLLLGVYFSPKATWEVSHDTLKVKASYSNDTVTEYKLAAQQNKCDEIVLDFYEQDQIILKRQ